MIRVLILDDSAAKSKKVTDTLNDIGGCVIECATDLVSARRALKAPFDLLILDMHLPERFNEVPKERQGLAFIEELKKSSRLQLPAAIIGLSEFGDIVSKYEEELKRNGIVLVRYDTKGADWQEVLKEKVRYLVKSSETERSFHEFQYDVAILAALREPELHSVLELDYRWQRKRFPNDASLYNVGQVMHKSGKVLNVICTSLPQMGLVACAFTTLKLISSFRPRYVIMTGICGGIKGGVELGDLVVSDSSFDLGSGKITRKEDGSQGFEPDFKPIPLSADLKEELIELSADRDVLRKVKDSWKGNAIPGELNLKIGPVGSGAAVIANNDYTDDVKAHQRKLIAIDMETYSIFYCCAQSNSPKPTALSIKAVCDYADHEKNDNIQKYCSHISAKMADHIIRHILSFE